MYEACSFCFIFCVALFWVLVRVYVVLISITSCYETDVPIIFLQASKILLTKKLKCRSLFWKEKMFKEVFEAEGIKVICKKIVILKKFGREFYICSCICGRVKVYLNSVGSKVKVSNGYVLVHWNLRVFSVKQLYSLINK